jgi:hypothetical protein
MIRALVPRGAAGFNLVAIAGDERLDGSTGSPEMVCGVTIQGEEIGFNAEARRREDAAGGE